MWKKSCSILFFIFIAHLCFSQYTLDRYHVKDSLSKYSVSCYSIYSYDGQDSSLLEVLQFDRNGDLIKESNLTYNFFKTYKYDSLQRQIEQVDYASGIITEITCSYYAENKLSKEIRKNSTGIINETREYFYEDSMLSHQHIISTYSSDGIIYERDYFYKYDSTTLHVTKLFGDSSHRTEIVRNKYGGIIYFEVVSRNNYNPKPSWFSYDKNLRTEMYSFFNNEKIVREKMLYDKYGKILEIQICGGEHYSQPCYTLHRFYYEYFDE